MRESYSTYKLIVFIIVALLAIVVLYLSYTYITEGFADDIRDVRTEQNPI